MADDDDFTPRPAPSAPTVPKKFKFKVSRPAAPPPAPVAPPAAPPSMMRFTVGSKREREAAPPEPEEPTPDLLAGRKRARYEGPLRVARVSVRVGGLVLRDPSGAVPALEAAMPAAAAPAPRRRRRDPDADQLVQLEGDLKREPGGGWAWSGRWAENFAKLEAGDDGAFAMSGPGDDGPLRTLELGGSFDLRVPTASGSAVKAIKERGVELRFKSEDASGWRAVEGRGRNEFGDFRVVGFYDPASGALSVSKDYAVTQYKVDSEDDDDGDARAFDGDYVADPSSPKVEKKKKKKEKKEPKAPPPEKPKPTYTKVSKAPVAYTKVSKAPPAVAAARREAAPDAAPAPAEEEHRRLPFDGAAFPPLLQPFRGFAEGTAEAERVAEQWRALSDVLASGELVPEEEPAEDTPRNRLLQELWTRTREESLLRVAREKRAAESRERKIAEASALAAAEREAGLAELERRREDEEERARRDAEAEDEAKRDADAERKRRREEARRNRDKLEQTVDLDKQRLAVSSFLEQHRAEGGDEFGE